MYYSFYLLILFKSQYIIFVDEVARYTNKIIIDFFLVYNNKQYFIEYDGQQHFEYTPIFHKGGIVDFEKEQRRDRVLNEFCELHKDKVTLIRFNYKQSNEEIIEKLKELELVPTIYCSLMKTKAAPQHCSAHFTKL